MLPILWKTPTIHDKSWFSDNLKFLAKLTIVDLASASDSTEQLYAYFFQPSPKYSTNHGWTIYDPMKEYKRMGMGSRSNSWRFTTINQSYTVCAWCVSVVRGA